VGVPAGYEELVFSIFDHRCASCGTTKKLTLDHHQPLERRNALLHNAVPLCSACNSSKRNKSPEEFYDSVTLQEIEVLLKKTREAFEAANGRQESP
jgi:5-methylcytosine-specific restriction endonuclease McrA